jgi:hypothetical protein
LVTGANGLVFIGVSAVEALSYPYADPSGALFFSAFARKKRPRLFGLKWCLWSKLRFDPTKCNLLNRDFYNRRNAVGGNMSIGQTTWRAGRRERCRYAAVSGDRAGMA